MRTGVYPVSSVDDTFVWLGVKENDEPPFRMCVCFVLNPCMPHKYGVYIFDTYLCMCVRCCAACLVAEKTLKSAEIMILSKIIRQSTDWERDTPYTDTEWLTGVEI